MAQSCGNQTQRAGSGQLQWVVSDLKAIRKERICRPCKACRADDVSLFFPKAGLSTAGSPIGSRWEPYRTRNLIGGRHRMASPGDQTEGRGVVEWAIDRFRAHPLEKEKPRPVRSRHDIRYVAIELGIGGWQPHPPRRVRARYGDSRTKPR